MGSPTVSVTYQWQCNGVDIPGATGLEYTALLFEGALPGAEIRLIETLTMDGGSASVSSNVITMEAPDILVLDQDYGRRQSRHDTLSHTIMDCRGGRWELSNLEEPLNRYPVFTADSQDVIIQGGEVHGNVPLDTPWQDTYVNACAVTARDTHDVIIKDWVITQVWDGIRIGGERNERFVIENCWVHIARDDAVENERGAPGIIRDCLFDYVNMGISLSHTSFGDVSDRVVTIERVLIRHQSYSNDRVEDGGLLHGVPFKMRRDSARIRVFDCVFAITQPDHVTPHINRLNNMWSKLLEGSGNYWLNLSDEPWPENYPLPPTDSFTILQGQAARDVWEARKAAWLAERGYAPRPFPPA